MWCSRRGVVIVGVLAGCGDSLSPPTVTYLEGALDPSFGANGLVTFGMNDDDVALASAVQPSGRIVTLVESYRTGDFSYDRAEAVAYTPAGALDASLGTAGVLDIGDIWTCCLYSHPLVTPDDGFILVTEYITVRLEHHLADGAFDFQTISVEEPSGLTVDSRGRLLVTSSDGGHLSRYNADGGLDESFGDSGMVSLPTRWSPGVQVFGDRIYLASAETNRSPIRIERLLDNGKPDPGFPGAEDARVTLSLALPNGTPSAFAIDPFGRVLVAGVSADDNHQVVAARFTPEGTIDPSYGDAGVVTVFSGVSGTYSDTRADVDSLAVGSDGSLVVAAGTDTVARISSDGAEVTQYTIEGARWLAVALQPDGRIVASGGIAQPGGLDAAVARFVP